MLPIEDFSFLKPTNFFSEIRYFIRFKKHLLIRCTILLSSAVVLLMLRFQVMEFTTPTFKPIDNPASFMDNIIFRIINYNYVYCLNAWLLVCPEWLCFDWSMGCIPLINDVDPRLLCIISLYVFLGLLTKFALLGDDHQKSRYLRIFNFNLSLPFGTFWNVHHKIKIFVSDKSR